MTCIASRIIHDLQKFQSAVDVYRDDALKIWCDQIHASQKFAFDFYPDQKFYDFSLECVDAEVFELPYETTYFEMPDWSMPNQREAVLAQITQTDLQLPNVGPIERGSLLVTGFHKDPELGMYVTAVSSCAFLRRPRQGHDFVMCALDPVKPEVYDSHGARFNPTERRGDLQMNAGHFLRATLLCWAALNSRSVGQKHVAAPRKLNDRRQKKGKPPIFEFREVSIVVPQEVVSSRALGGSHASPRLHWRRGHIRTLPGGKKTPVAPCIVGASENGAIIKEYKAKLADGATIH